MKQCNCKKNCCTCQRYVVEVVKLEPNRITIYYNIGNSESFFITPSAGIEGDDTFYATPAQTIFTLTDIPTGKLIGFIAGAKKPSLVFTNVGTTVTYDKTQNDNYELELNDRIDFIY